MQVEVILKDSEAVRLEPITLTHGAADTWAESAVRDVLVEMLRAIDRAQHPRAPRDRQVVLTGFNWIVEPIDGGVMLALLIPTGTAAIGPLAVEAARLDALVTSVLRTERARASKTTVH